MDKALDLFERRFPHAQALFIFDQSSAHGSFAEDALLAHKMNAGPGGKQPKMHDTLFSMEHLDPTKHSQMQTMVFPAGHEREGQAKGMIKVLEERSLYQSLFRNNKKPVKQCHSCTQSAEQWQKAQEDAAARINADENGQTTEGKSLYIYGSMN
jgi:hypothetical protein